MRGPRVSLVTLGVSDLERSRAFYEAWGWRPVEAEDGVVFYQANGLVISLFGVEALAEDQARPGETLGTGAMTLAQNYPNESAVDKVFKAGLAAGASMLKRPQKVFWGGYSGYLADPDGHVWEIAYNPYWTVERDGSVVLERDDDGA